MKTFERRTRMEYSQLRLNPPEGLKIEESDSISDFVIELQCPNDTLYANETFHLKFKLTSNYPIESHEVTFIREIPVNEHVYSNGHICLSILYQNWSPALTIASVSLSILSMLSSTRQKKRPLDDESYCKTHVNVSPKNTKWGYDDDSV